MTVSGSIAARGSLGGRRRAARCRVLALALLVAVGAVPKATANDRVTVFAAASLSDAMTAATQRWTAQTGIPVRLSFAASSTLARQIEAGAPADLFASANRRWMDYLVDHGQIDGSTQATPLANRLALVAPVDHDRVSAMDAAWAFTGADLISGLGDRDRLAVGDPDHVPAGIYAAQVLESLGVWDVLAPRLARADNVRGALALVARGEVPLGLVYATDAAIDPSVAVLALVPVETHDPIVYPLALLPDASEAAASLLDFLQGEEAAAVFSSYGFVTTD